MNRNYFCPFCRFVYCPTQGDWTNNVPPNTAFASLTDSWACPKCHAPKHLFQGGERPAHAMKASKKAHEPQEPE